MDIRIEMSGVDVNHLAPFEDQASRIHYQVAGNQSPAAKSQRPAVLLLGHPEYFLDRRQPVRYFLNAVLAQGCHFMLHGF